MRIGRTVPPAAAPLRAVDLWQGLVGLLRSRRALERLQAELAQYLGVRHVFLVSSGTAALTITLKALRSASSRTGVVIPGYTCFSVPGAVVHAGLRPVPCDIDAATFDFDHACLAQTVDDDTLCVVAHHLFGMPSDISRTTALCRARGVFVVEDAAQAFGASSKGVPVGTIGDVGIFSFGRGKNITAGGGGAIVTNSDALADLIRRQCDDAQNPSAAETIVQLAMLLAMGVFIRPAFYWIPAALPFLRLGETIFPADVPLKRMSGLQAGALRHWRTRLRESTRVRTRTAMAFGRRLGIAWTPNPYLRLPIFAASPAEKRTVLARSQRLGLGLSSGYPSSIDLVPELRPWSTGVSCPTARRVADHMFTVPVHHWLRARDRRAICECLGVVARSTCPSEEMPHAS
jgi:perosamine synthetase